MLIFSPQIARGMDGRGKITGTRFLLITFDFFSSGEEVHGEAL